MEGNNRSFQALLKSYKLGKGKPLKILLYMYKGNWSKLILSTIFFILKHSPTWILPIVTANIINIASYPKKYNVNELWINVIIAAVSVAQNIITEMLHIKYLSKPIREVEEKLRSNLVRKLQILSISYHKELKSGKLQSKILRDVEAIQTLSLQICTTVFPVIFNIIVALVVTFSKNWIMAIIFIIVMPISVAIMLLFGKNVKRTNTEFRKEIENMSADVAEMVDMVPITRAHALEEVEIKKIDKRFESIRRKGYHLDMTTALLGASGWVFFQLFQVIFLGFTGFLAYKNSITVGEVVLYQGYLGTIIGQVSSVINVYPIIVKGIESINSVGEIILVNDIENNKGKKKLKDVYGEFSFRNVGFKYKDSTKPILKEFNLNVKKGETVAFVGESGAGKTTLLNLIIGFNKVTSGSIVVDGIDINKIDLRSYREKIAVVPQNTMLFSGSIKDNITYGLSNVSEEKLQKVIEYANLENVIKRMPKGIETIIKERGHNMSGGQKQRIAIARAIIREPNIIILDEATSALDNVSEFMVQKAINNLIKDHTTFIVAHRLSTIKNADHIVVLKGGKCVEEGTYEELVSRKGQFYKDLSTKL
ncbi:ABC transporter ATP-binding protein [Clostridium felsineum]|uniref:ABC transporter ATP-binding protein n=1 Tax=Clostridium felsineum TaxID=36839 RepID=UPI00098C9143|nr:ABC transporter ATP-binding protein [Clostridium felsineum]URZ17405.1 Putative multidrug export ATP-binding/permease protein [Clostridium felsineum DSM 794]